MEDKCFHETVLEKFIEVLKLPYEIVTPESDDECTLSLINLGFIQLMNFYID